MEQNKIRSTCTYSIFKPYTECLFRVLLYRFTFQQPHNVNKELCTRFQNVTKYQHGSAIENCKVLSNNYALSKKKKKLQIKLFIATTYQRFFYSVKILCIKNCKTWQKFTKVNKML